MTLLAIDPGNVESGYVYVYVEGGNIVRILDKGKIPNDSLLRYIRGGTYTDMAIEMIASYGMPVGAEVFETCVWIGRFAQEALHRDDYFVPNIRQIYRKDEKLTICGSPKAKDSNIRQALADFYAPGEPNFGKGTKKEPGFFYGFKADIWQAFAVAHTYVEKYYFPF